MPVIAHVEYSGTVLAVGVILNQNLIDYMDEFSGGQNYNFKSVDLPTR